MKIHLMRHYRVKMDYKHAYDSCHYMQDSIAYNRKDVYHSHPIGQAVGTIYASSMKRAIQTAEMAFGHTPEILPGVYEITMKNCRDTARVLPRWYWESMARLHWTINHSSQYETRDETFDRLARALDVLEARGGDATIVMHGHAMRCMAIILKQRGYRGPYILSAKNGKIYPYERNA